MVRANDSDSLEFPRVLAGDGKLAADAVPRGVAHKQYSNTIIWAHVYISYL